MNGTTAIVLIFFVGFTAGAVVVRLNGRALKIALLLLALLAGAILAVNG